MRRVSRRKTRRYLRLGKPGVARSNQARDRKSEVNFNQLLARIAIQADADIIAFGGLGLVFDDYYFFRTRFEDEGIFGRTVMFVNLASDPIVERVLTPDMVLKVAERFAVEEKKRVLVF